MRIFQHTSQQLLQVTLLKRFVSVILLKLLVLFDEIHSLSDQNLYQN